MPDTTVETTRGQNTHGQGDWVKIPLSPNIVGKMLRPRDQLNSQDNCHKPNF